MSIYSMLGPVGLMPRQLLTLLYPRPDSGGLELKGAMSSTYIDSPSITSKLDNHTGEADSSAVVPDTVDIRSKHCSHGQEVPFLIASK